ncbi:MAG: 50S ribosomal protein L6 [Bacteroidetes bacterium]|nr:MAG: 50S ribosomal protein L6 [Bacteroidota bacterium]
MSRIGKAPIKIPQGIDITISNNNLVTVKGPKGELMQQVDPDMGLTIEDGVLALSRPTEQKRHKAAHGLYRALLANMIVGVSEGFVKELELIGVGYRVANHGNLLELTVGYSHPIMFYIPDEIKLETVMEKGKPPSIRMECTDKQLLGHIAAKIRALRKPEPYKGKGIKYKGEILRRKAGKTAG